MRKRLHAAGSWLLALLALGQGGCASLGFRREAVPNPLVVPTRDFESVWKATVQAVDDYFDIASENRLSRTIRTEPKMGATLLEPWYGDSADVSQRLEATLQSIRRYAIVHVEPAPSGAGLAVRVEVFKELEDLAKPDRQTAGRATFTSQFPVNRVREIVGPIPLPIGWIDKGRDAALEQVILGKIRRKLAP
ncbi:MAG TPA: hypothetical protein VG406_00095 [Isosphaeraceae bacterium]|jgi:hypothetical protein|nr:hypothetical protein [Isosphaeraceae bacterium]